MEPSEGVMKVPTAELHVVLPARLQLSCLPYKVTVPRYLLMSYYGTYLPSERECSMRFYNCVFSMINSPQAPGLIP